MLLLFGNLLLALTLLLSIWLERQKLQEMRELRLCAQIGVAFILLVVLKCPRARLPSSVYYEFRVVTAIALCVYSNLSVYHYFCVRVYFGI